MAYNGSNIIILKLIRKSYSFNAFTPMHNRKLWPLTRKELKGTVILEIDVGMQK
jgi:hypothetical protein